MTMKDLKTGAGLAVGIALGAVIGVATDNLALWLAAGVAFGIGLGGLFRRRA